MKMQHLIPILSLSALVELALMNCSLVRAAELSPETRTNFEWFSGLGFPDVKGCPLVRVEIHSWSTFAGLPHRNDYLNVFLLATNSAGITVVEMGSMGVSKETLHYGTNGTPGFELVGFQPADLKEIAQSALVVNTNLTERQPLGFFVLAWACWRNGLDSEAEQLCVAARTKFREYERVYGPDFHIQLEKDIGQFVTGRAEWDFGKPAISREQLLSEYQNIASNYPDAWEHDRTEQWAAILKRMVAEDEAHAKNAPTNLDVLPVDQRVRELIFQLRDQNGEQMKWDQPGGFDIFNDSRGTNSPAGKLVAIGYPAVPQLIVALDDSTFSRSLGWFTVHGDLDQIGSARTVLTVGDYALAIIERITGKTFYPPVSSSAPMSYMKKNGEVRKAVEAWWADFQKKGEKEMLIEGTEAGDVSSPAEGTLLIERYPDAALQPLIKGTSAATDKWTKKSLFELFDKIYSTNAESFLEEEMNSGDDAPYFAAARVLYRHGNSEALPVMIHRWESTADPDVLDFLASVDSPQAIAALGKNLQSRPFQIRKQVVGAMVREVSSYGYYVTNLSAATLDAREELLVTALQDTGPEIVMSRPINYQDQRVCDWAGVFLHDTWFEPI